MEADPGPETLRVDTPEAFDDFEAERRARGYDVVGVQEHERR